MLRTSVIKIGHVMQQVIFTRLKTPTYNQYKTCRLPLMVLCLLYCSINVQASSTTTEPDANTYHFVDHHQITINQPARLVWPHLVNLGSWMYEFEMAHVSGEPGKEGQVMRLYEGQDFMMQITKIVPNQLLTLVNLPSTFNDEYSTGIGVTTLFEINGKTVVSLTMDRRYTYIEPKSSVDNDATSAPVDNPMRALRESAAFIENTRAMWEDRFLARLKQLAEADNDESAR